jgi:ketosteroid isomerase-like protein
MRNLSLIVLCVLAVCPVFAAPQEKSKSSTGNAALEKELFAVEKKWMKAEFDKRKTGPDSMGELWMDDFFDVLPDGKVVNKEEMMEMMAKTDRKPGTGAFPDTFKLRAVYGNVALASDHTVIKGVDSSGKLVTVREMGVLRMFVKDKGKWRVAGAGLVPIVAR